MRTLVFFGLGSAAAIALLAWVLPRMTDRATGATILAAAVISCGAGFVALTPVAIVVRHHPAWRMQAAMAALTLRMLLTLGAGFAFLKVAGPPQQLFLKSLVVCYLVLLVVETAITLRLAGGTGGPPTAK